MKHLQTYKKELSPWTKALFFPDCTFLMFNHHYNELLDTTVNSLIEFLDKKGIIVETCPYRDDNFGVEGGEKNLILQFNCWGKIDYYLLYNMFTIGGYWIDEKSMWINLEVLSKEKPTMTSFMGIIKLSWLDNNWTRRQ